MHHNPQPGLVGTKPNPHEYAELRAALQRAEAENERLRHIERAAREALALSNLGRYADAYDVLNAGLAGGEPVHRVRHPMCCSPEVD